MVDGKQVALLLCKLIFPPQIQSAKLVLDIMVVLFAGIMSRTDKVIVILKLLKCGEATLESIY